MLLTVNRRGTLCKMSFAQQPPEKLELSQGIVLRALRVEDADGVYAVVDANREHLRVWLPWVDGTRSAADTRAFLLEVGVKRAAGQTLAYGLWEGEALRGILGFHDISVSNGNLQVGYWLSREGEGRGLMTTAVTAMLGVAYDMLRMERVEIRCAVRNRRSWAIPERLGFSLEGVLRHFQRLHGEYVDMRVYSMLEREYRERFAKAESAQDVEGGL